MRSPSLSSIEFRRACAQFATGVAVAAVMDDEGTPHGLTVNSFTSVSLDPPLVLICIDHRSTLFARFEQAAHYSINILSEQQRELSNRFAAKVEARFEGVEWKLGSTGVPLLKASLSTMECEVQQRIVCGDHTVYVAEVMAVKVSGGSPLVYFDSGYRGIAG